MSDVLVVVALVPGAYPTVNHLGKDGQRGGRKSVEYHDLGKAVKDAAEAEIARVGWVTSTYPCAVSFTLYHRTGIFPDVDNIPKCPNDFLAVAGVFTTDKLARPVVVDVEYDPDGPARLVIIVRRRFPSYRSKLALPVVRARSITKVVPPVVADVAVVPVKWAYVDGKRIPYDVAMAAIRKGMR